MLFPREFYTNKLLRWKDKDLIKVLTGIRRCGKSTIFTLFQEELKTAGVSEKHIIDINLEKREYRELQDERRLYDYVEQHLDSRTMNYVFIDEVGLAEGFERAADALFVKENVDLYLTGSNADLLSSDLATLLSGRYIEIMVYPFSFKEYVQAQHLLDAAVERSSADLYREYLSCGSFPYVSRLDGRDSSIEYLEGLFNTVLIKDIVKRGSIRDVNLLRRVIDFCADNISNLSAPKRISDALSAGGRRVAQSTVESYLDLLENSYVFYQAKRYDIRGKRHLERLSKYYLVDPGLRTLLLGRDPTDYGRLLENVVFLELKRRYSQVSVGKLATGEVDFVAQDSDGPRYFQVAETVKGDTTLRRELAPFSAIPDQYPRTLLTLDNYPDVSHGGVSQRYVLDWLLE